MSRCIRVPHVMIVFSLLGMHGLQATVFGMAVTSLQASPKPVSAVDPCSLLKKDDATAALGDAKLSGPDRVNLKNVPGFSECVYRVTRKVQNYGQCSPAPTVGIPYPLKDSCSYSSLITLIMVEIPPNPLEADRAPCMRKGTEGIPDLGDVACWTDSSHEQVWVTKGTILFSIWRL